MNQIQLDSSRSSILQSRTRASVCSVPDEETSFTPRFDSTSIGSSVSKFVVQNGRLVRQSIEIDTTTTPQETESEVPSSEPLIEEIEEPMEEIVVETVEEVPTSSTADMFDESTQKKSTLAKELNALDTTAILTKPRRSPKFGQEVQVEDCVDPRCDHAIVHNFHMDAIKWKSFVKNLPENHRGVCSFCREAVIPSRGRSKVNQLIFHLLLVCMRYFKSPQQASFRP